MKFNYFLILLVLSIIFISGCSEETTSCLTCRGNWLNDINREITAFNSTLNFSSYITSVQFPYFNVVGGQLRFNTSSISVGTQKTAKRPYLYNDTNFYYFNETKLNQTIIKKINSNLTKYRNITQDNTQDNLLITNYNTSNVNWIDQKYFSETEIRSMYWNKTQDTQQDTNTNNSIKRYINNNFTNYYTKSQINNNFSSIKYFSYFNRTTTQIRRNITASYVKVLTLTLPATLTSSIECMILNNASATTVGIQYRINFTNTATRILTGEYYNGTTTSNLRFSGTATSNTHLPLFSSGTVISNLKLYATTTPSSAGVMTIELKSELAGSPVYVLVGSWCRNTNK